jgi:hypothetical protein
LTVYSYQQAEIILSPPQSNIIEEQSIALFSFAGLYNKSIKALCTFNGASRDTKNAKKETLI